ncbi:hypothetical protein EYS14_03275 [Alteromonadaceae bacterium M269]|nr:hypothetical protein EYS14_03275 [Alteromonadaceae bacterium M269]
MPYFTEDEAKQTYANHIRDNSNELVAVILPVKGEAWADFEAKIVARAPITPSDFFYDFVNGGLRITTNAKQNVDPGRGAQQADDLHVALIDTVNERVRYVGDAKDRVITNEEGDVLRIPGIDFEIPEITGPDPEAAV